MIPVSIKRVLRGAAEPAFQAVERIRLQLAGHHKLALAIDGRDCPLAPQIEAWRDGMLADNSPLVDGSLTLADYDAGTYSDAAKVSRRGAGARALYSVAAEYRPRTILELGTNIGISAAYLAAAGGNVTTLDASAYRLRLARRLHDSLGLKISHVHGKFIDTLPDVLKQLPPVELAFIDGHHQYQPTLDYFEMISAHAAPGCVYIFDDIRYSRAMWKAWRELKVRFEATADMGGMGVAIIQRSPLQTRTALLQS